MGGGASFGAGVPSDPPSLAGHSAVAGNTGYGGWKRPFLLNVWSLPHSGSDRESSGIINNRREDYVR